MALYDQALAESGAAIELRLGYFRAIGAAGESRCRTGAASAGGGESNQLMMSAT